MGIHPSTTTRVIAAIDRTLRNQVLAAKVAFLEESAAPKHRPTYHTDSPEDRDIQRRHPELNNTSVRYQQWSVETYPERTQLSYISHRDGTFRTILYRMVASVEPCGAPDCECQVLFADKATVYDDWHRSEQELKALIDIEDAARRQADAQHQ